MALLLEIPDSVAGGLQLPAPEVESRLCSELAVGLYSQGIRSFGKARELISKPTWLMPTVVNSGAVRAQSRAAFAFLVTVSAHTVIYTNWKRRE